MVGWLAFLLVQRSVWGRLGVSGHDFLSISVGRYSDVTRLVETISPPGRTRTLYAFAYLRTTDYEYSLLGKSSA